MKLRSVLISCLFFYFHANAQITLTAPQVVAGSSILRQMHAKYYHGICKSYTFSQHNKHYRNDSVIKESEWHEAIEFPDKFRIIYGDKANGDYVLYRNDSAYNYKGNKLVKQRPDSSSLLLLIGGMFYRNFDDVVLRLKKKKYDVDFLAEETWNNGQQVYVIGGKPGDMSANQIWIDKKTFWLVRIIQKIGEKDVMDMRFEERSEWCDGSVETKVSFRRNGKLEQEEVYFDLKETAKFPD